MIAPRNQLGALICLVVTLAGCGSGAKPAATAKEQAEATASYSRDLTMEVLAQIENGNRGEARSLLEELAEQLRALEEEFGDQFMNYTQAHADLLTAAENAKANANSENLKNLRQAAERLPGSRNAE